MGSFQHSKRSDNKHYTVKVRWSIFIENLTVFFYSKKPDVNIPIQTLIISSWLLFRKMIISQLEHGPPVIKGAGSHKKFMIAKKKISLTDRATLPLIPLVNRTLSSRITASDMKVRRRNTKQWHTCRRCFFNTHLLTCAQLSLGASPLRLPP